MKLIWGAILIGCLCVLIDPAPALAWGPATHIGLGASVLDNLAVLPAAIAALLARHRLSFLYGNIAADVVFAKRLSRIKQCCHHWTTGFAVLDAARDDRARAFAYGYLSHLAADTVAHGKYVPRQLVISNGSINFGHLYWELRADALEGESRWRLLERVLEHSHEHHHRLLEPHITDTFLPYVLNRVLFDGMNALAARKGFRRTMVVWNRWSPYQLSSALLNEYRAESLDRVYAILFDGKRSAVLREDPNGTASLMHVRVRRRALRRMRRRGLSTEQWVREASRGLAPSATPQKPPPRGIEPLLPA